MAIKAIEYLKRANTAVHFSVHYRAYIATEYFRSPSGAKPGPNWCLQIAHIKVCQVLTRKKRGEGRAHQSPALNVPVFVPLRPIPPPVPIILLPVD